MSNHAHAQHGRASFDTAAARPAQDDDWEGGLAAWCYILRCQDGSYYTGCTTDLDGRIAHHEAGTLGGYTSTRRPVSCVWAEEFQSIHDAIDAERRIKGWSRAKKEAMIAGDWDAVRHAARSYQHHPR